MFLGLGLGQVPRAGAEEDQRRQLDAAGFEPRDTAAPGVALADGNGGIKGRRPSKKDRLRAAAAAAGGDAPPAS